MKKIFSLNLSIIILLFTSVWVLRIIDLSTYPIPLPLVHDEVANYLGAETFALGRLTNPAHKFSNSSLAEIYILPEPTRMMKYQPAMAGFMALGISIFDDAYWGIVLLVALAVAASYWSISGWTNRRVAFCAAIFLLLLLRAPHYWINSYWGGAHSLLGAFLLLGAYPRILHHKQYKYLWIAMIGAAISMLSRPYEAILFIISLSICGLYSLHKNFTKEEKKSFIKSAILPLLFIGGSLVSFQLYYNKAITNDYLTTPYMEYQKTREVTPFLWFLNTSESNTSNNYGIRSSQEEGLEILQKDRTNIIISSFPVSINQLIGTLNDRKNTIFIIAINLLLILVFLAYPSLLCLNLINKKYLELHFFIIVQTIGYLLIIWPFMAHYLAIYLATYITLLSLNLHDVYLRAKNKKALNIITSITAVTLTIFLLTHNTKFSDNFKYKYSQSIELKKSIEIGLNKDNDKHLILADLRTKGVYSSFITNEPNIDRAKIIWAWYLSPEENKKIIDYYNNRKIWYINPYKEKHLIPYKKYQETQ